MLKERHSHKVTWSDVNGTYESWTHSNNGSAFSDVLDLRAERIVGLKCHTRGGAAYGGTAVTFALFPCNEDGSIIYDDLGAYWMSPISVPGVAVTDNYASCSPYIVSGVIAVPVPDLRSDFAVLKTVGGELNKTIAVSCDVITER